MMLRFATTGILLLSLSACGSVNDDGSVATGPLGQEPLMNAEVRSATRQAIDVCIAALRGAGSLSDLQAQGFEPRRSGYRKVIDKPGLMMADSIVGAQLEQPRGCTVTVTPAFPVEVQTIQSLARDALPGSSGMQDVSFGRVGDGLYLTIR